MFNTVIEVHISKLSTIRFETDLEFRKGDNVTINYNDKTYNFEVIEIYINESDCFIVARDIGYYNNIYDLSNERLKKLIGVEIKKVIDKDEIKQINKESHYI